MAGLRKNRKILDYALGILTEVLFALALVAVALIISFAVAGLV